MFLSYILSKILHVVIRNKGKKIMETVIVKILLIALGKLSPQIRAALVHFVGELDKAAQKSENEWDDIAVMLAKALLGI